MYRVVNADFVGSYGSLESLPPSESPEVACVGRSNSGKSSLLNAIFCRKDLVRTGRTPGVTQRLNVFSLKLKTDTEKQPQQKKGAGLSELLFVDLPGYGFATVSTKERATWNKEIPVYLAGRPNLKALVLVMDIRREIEEEEHWVLSTFSDIPVFAVLTKSDKLNRKELNTRIHHLKSELQTNGCSRVFPLSTQDANSAELAKLRQTLLGESLSNDI